jgi:1,4-alpha-glucan branching enzyme
MLQKSATRTVPRRVAIAVHAPEATEVRVTGDFTHWVKQGIRLSHDGNGPWRTVLPLEPGTYQYRLLIDGEWKDHAEATERVRNPFGSENCVLMVL